MWIGRVLEFCQIVAMPFEGKESLTGVLLSSWYPNLTLFWCILYPSCQLWHCNTFQVTWWGDQGPLLRGISSQNHLLLTHIASFLCFVSTSLALSCFGNILLCSTWSLANHVQVIWLEVGHKFCVQLQDISIYPVVLFHLTWTLWFLLQVYPRTWFGVFWAFHR